MAYAKTYRKHFARTCLLVFVFAITALTGCGLQAGNTPVDLLTWISGSDVINQAGVYGMEGMPVDATRQRVRDYLAKVGGFAI